MVRAYKNKDLLDRVKSLLSFTSIPDDYWILGVQSQEDTYNRFDDKFYIFKGEEFIMVTSGTTNSGSYGLYNFAKYFVPGVAVIKTNEWYYNLWKSGLHKGRMKALVQVNDILFYRDSNKNKSVEENSSELFKGIIGVNFHTVTYTSNNIIRRLIGSWSVGCQVCNNSEDYKKILSLVKNQEFVNYCLIKEF